MCALLERQKLPQRDNSFQRAQPNIWTSCSHQYEMCQMPSIDWIGSGVVCKTKWCPYAGSCFTLLRLTVVAFCRIWHCMMGLILPFSVSICLSGMTKGVQQHPSPSDLTGNLCQWEFDQMVACPQWLWWEFTVCFRYPITIRRRCGLGMCWIIGFFRIIWFGVWIWMHCLKANWADGIQLMTLFNENRFMHFQ